MVRPTHPTRPGLNLLDGGWYAADSHEVWRWMRRHAPVYYDETADVWGIAKYEDVLAIEKDPVAFSSYRAPRPHGMHLPMMISMDDPEHKARRGLVNRGFTPRRIAEMEPKVAALCRGLVDRISGVGSCDFVWDVAAPLPLMVIADLLGFDVAVCRHISIFTEYKFIDALGTDGKSTSVPSPGGTYRFKPDQVEQNLITAGVKYSF